MDPKIYQTWNTMKKPMLFGLIAMFVGGEIADISNQNWDLVLKVGCFGVAYAITLKLQKA